MRKALIFLASALAFVLVFTAVGCSNKQFEEPIFIPKSDVAEQSDSSSSEQTDNEDIQQTTTPNSSSYYSVYNDYKEELSSKTNLLIQQLMSELSSSDNQYDSKAADLIDKSKSELSVIYNQGLSELILVMQEKKTDYSEYDYWAEKLSDEYNSDINRIQSICQAENLGENEDIDY